MPVKKPSPQAISQRATVLAAMCEGESTIHALADCRDVRRNLDVVAALGVPLRATGPASITVTGRHPSSWRASGLTLDAGNSATTSRLLVAVLVAVRLSGRVEDDRAGGGTAPAHRATPGELARLGRSWTSVLHLSLLQGVLGYVQYFTGVPILLVLTHMLFAALLAVALTLGTLNLYRNPV